jgi:hypothetical protein
LPDTIDKPAAITNEMIEDYLLFFKKARASSSSDAAVYLDPQV